MEGHTNPVACVVLCGMGASHVLLEPLRSTGAVQESSVARGLVLFFLFYFFASAWLKTKGQAQRCDWEQAAGRAKICRVRQLVCSCGPSELRRACARFTVLSRVARLGLAYDDSGVLRLAARRSPCASADTSAGTQRCGRRREERDDGIRLRVQVQVQVQAQVQAQAQAQSASESKSFVRASQPSQAGKQQDGGPRCSLSSQAAPVGLL